MKNSLVELKSYDIVLMDGSKAKVKDILFDDQTWIIRYIEADFGSIFLDKRILIPRMLIKECNSESKELQLGITKEIISNCPKPEDDNPLSRIYEEQLNRHYGTPLNWLNSTAFYYYAPKPINNNHADVAEKYNLNSSLRSFNDLKGYCICAIDYKIGRIEDMIVDGNSWHISYLVIETADWLPLNKRIVVSIYKTENISYSNKEANLSLTTNIIKNAPPYDSFSDYYERSLHDYYEGSSI